MQIPTVHLNGTGGESLLKQVTEAGDAVNNAIEKLRAAWPNGRDYYVQGENATKEAMHEWWVRTEKLHEVRSELEAIAHGVAEQMERAVPILGRQPELMDRGFK